MAPPAPHRPGPRVRAPRQRHHRRQTLTVADGAHPALLVPERLLGPHPPRVLPPAAPAGTATASRTMIESRESKACRVGRPLREAHHALVSTGGPREALDP